MSVGDNVSAGHFQCGKMQLSVTFILAIVSEVKESTLKQEELVREVFDRNFESIEYLCKTMSVRNNVSVGHF